MGLWMPTSCINRWFRKTSDICYMVESEKYSEKRLSIDLRYTPGEAMFWKIANENPKIYLGI